MDSLCSTSSEKGYFSPSVLKGRKNVKNENLNEEYRLIDFIFLSKQNSSVHSFLIWFLSIRHFQFLPLSFHIYCVLFKNRPQKGMLRPLTATNTQTDHFQETSYYYSFLYCLFPKYIIVLSPDIINAPKIPLMTSKRFAN